MQVELFKNKFMKTFNSTLIILLIVFISSCDKETEKITHGNIRGAVKLSINKIPALEGATAIKSGERPWLWKMGWNGDNYDFIKYFYAWTLSDSDFVNVDMVITQSNEEALRYITERLNDTPFPLNASERQDKPAIVGDVSYDKGSNFIRENIIIEMHAEGIFMERKEKLALQIDKIIVEGTSVSSLSQIMPVIKDFRIIKNPVIERTKTMIEIEVKDPNDKEIFYQWNINTSIGLGGNIIQENGNYFYESNSTYTNVQTNVDELTMIVINEFGFFTDSTITITTIKK